MTHNAMSDILNIILWSRLRKGKRIYKYMCFKFGKRKICFVHVAEQKSGMEMHFVENVERRLGVYKPQIELFYRILEISGKCIVQDVGKMDYRLKAIIKLYLPYTLARTLGKKHVIGGISFNSILETYWFCNSCGMKFRDLDELEILFTKQIKTAKNLKYV